MAKLIRILIDTDSYTGNFERILCAYATGQYNKQDPTGKYYSEIFGKDIKNIDWWNKNIAKSIVGMCENNEGSYHSLSINVKKTPPQEVLEELIERVSNFCKNKTIIDLEVHNFRVNNEESSMMRFMLQHNYIEPREEKITFKSVRIFEGVKDPIFILEKEIN